MLTFENDPKNETLEVHTDLKGLKYLHSQIESLIKHAEEKGNEHLHLMTEDWGGKELTNEKQCDENALFNHVKIFCWHNKD
jgi:hypothetical protein